MCAKMQMFRVRSSDAFQATRGVVGGGLGALVRNLSSSLAYRFSRQSAIWYYGLGVMKALSGFGLRSNAC